MIQHKNSMVFSIKLIAAAWIVLGLYYFLYCIPYPNYPETSTTKLINYPQGQKGVVEQIGYFVIDSMSYPYHQRMPLLHKNLNQKKGQLLNMMSVIPSWTSNAVRSMFTGSNLFQLINLERITRMQQQKMDNLYKQIIASNKTAMAMGDSVWAQIFPFQQGQQYFDYKSFDLKVNQVNTLISLFQQKMQQRINGQIANKFVIGHYQQIDKNFHHTKDMKALPILINQIDQWLDKYLNKLNNNTFFIALGDHGSTRQRGEHSGNSKQEMQTFLYTYFKTDQQIPYNGEVKYKVRIIDIASTLSILYDVPIPSNSVGYPIIQVLPQPYHKYFGEIELKMLKHYKTLIDFYEFEDSLSCSRIHFWIQDSEKTGKTPHDGTFYMQRREKIVSELYEHCLAKLLTTKPYPFANIVPFGLVFVLYFAFKKLYPKITFNLQTISDFICLFGTRALVGIFLFIKYNLLPYYQILLIFLLLTSKNIQKASKLIGLIIIVLLPIFEQKTFGVQYSHSLTFSRGLIQSLLDSNTWRYILGYIFYFGLLVHMVSLQLPLWKSLKKIQYKKLPKMMVILTIATVIQLILEVIMLYYSFTTYQYFQGIYGRNPRLAERKKVLLVFFLIYIVRAIILVLRKVVKNDDGFQYKKQNKAMIISFRFNSSLIFMILLITILRNLQPFSGLLVYFLIKLVNKKQINTLMTFIICQIFWKTLGNNFEYSSLDAIKQHALFSDWGIKAICTFLYYTSSIYLIGLLVIHEKLQQQSSNNSSRLLVTDRQLQQRQTIVNNDSQQIQSMHNRQNDGQDKNLVAVQNKFQIEFIKFIFPVYAGLFTAMVSIIPLSGTEESFKYLILFNYSVYNSIFIVIVIGYYIAKNKVNGLINKWKARQAN